MNKSEINPLSPKFLIYSPTVVGRTKLRARHVGHKWSSLVLSYTVKTVRSQIMESFGLRVFEVQG